MVVIGTFSEPEVAQGAGMVWSTRDRTLLLMRGIFSDWEPARQAFIVNYAPHAASVAAGLTGALYVARLKRQFGMFKENWQTRWFPLPLTMLVPASIAFIGHQFHVTDDILLQETVCPVCLETRAISMQVAAGALLPPVAALAGYITVGQQVRATWLPRVGLRHASDRAGLVKLLKTTVARQQPLLLGVTMLHMLLAGGLVYGQVRCYEEVMAELEERYEAGQREDGEALLRVADRDITQKDPWTMRI